MRRRSQVGPWQSPARCISAGCWGTPSRSATISTCGESCGSSFALVVTWAYDTGAYLVGRSIGKRRIFQHLSAGKTLEGTLGGAFIAVMVAALYAQFTPFPPSPILAGLIGLGAAVFAQLGDLVESLLKRGADVKESGSLVPGHGGILDRIDSLLFTGPYMFYAALIWASLQLGA